MSDEGRGGGQHSIHSGEGCIEEGKHNDDLLKDFAEGPKCTVVSPDGVSRGGGGFVSTF